MYVTEDKMVEETDPEPTSSHENTKITTNC